MENWQTVAHESFPELQEAINDRLGLGVTGLWVELNRLLVEAYEVNPVDDGLIERVYKYAAWCLAQPQVEGSGASEDPSSAAAVGLIQNLPLTSGLAGDLPRWMSLESFEGFENIFRYHLDDAQYRKFAEDFKRKKKLFTGPSVI